MKKSVQLYSIRTLAARDYEAALKAVSEIGYEGVEAAGFFDHSAEQVLEWLNKYGLKVSGAHVGAELMFDKPEETIAYHKTIGNTRIICPGYHLETAADVAELAAKFNAVAPLYKAAGMTMGYHNHSFEFKKDNGQCLIDLLAQAVPAEILELEFDVYWIYRGGECPVSYLNNYKNRMSVFHAKDGTQENGTELGKGAVDMTAVFKTVKANNRIEWAVVESEANEGEQEQVESIRADFKALTKLIEK